MARPYCIVDPAPEHLCESPQCIVGEHCEGHLIVHSRWARQVVETAMMQGKGANPSSLLPFHSCLWIPEAHSPL